MTQVPQEFKDILEAKGFAHMATIGPKGEPQASPVWYDFDGEHVLISHTKERQKFANLQRDPRVALSILDPNDPYRSLEIRGTVEVVDDPEGTMINRLSRKYEDKDFKTEPPSVNRVILKIRPERVTTHG